MAIALRFIERPAGKLVGVPQHVMGRRPVHEEETVDGDRCVLDWFWAEDEERIAIRAVNMRTGKIVWMEPAAEAARGEETADHEL